MTDSRLRLEQLGDMAGEMVRELENLASLGESSPASRYRLERLEQIRTIVYALEPSPAELALAELERRADMFRAFRRAALAELATKAGRYWQGSSYGNAADSVTRHNLEIAAADELAAQIGRAFAERCRAELRLAELTVAEGAQGRRRASADALADQAAREADELAAEVSRLEAAGDPLGELPLERGRLIDREKAIRANLETSREAILAIVRIGLEAEAGRKQLAELELELALLVDKAGAMVAGA
jgi:hypothetical protein